jgi:hypothetical protein
VGPEGLGKLKKFVPVISSLTCDLPAFSIVPQPLHYRMPLSSHLLDITDTEAECIFTNMNGMKMLLVVWVNCSF